MKYTLAATTIVSDNPYISTVISACKDWKNQYKLFFGTKEIDPLKDIKEKLMNSEKVVVFSGVSETKYVEGEIYDPVVWGYLDRKPDVDYSDMGYVIRQLTSSDENIRNMDTFTEIWNMQSRFSNDVSAMRMLKFYSAVHKKQYTDIREVPEIHVSRKQLESGGYYTYGQKNTYAWVVNSRHAVLETLRHINLLKRNGIVYCDNFNERTWYILEQPQCEGELVQALQEAYHGLSLTEYNNRIKKLVTRINAR